MEEKLNKIGYQPSWPLFLFFGGLAIASLYSSVWWGGIIFGICALLVFPNKNAHAWIMQQFANIKSLIKSLLYLGIVLLVGGLFIWGGWKVLVKVGAFITPDTWTLMVCKEKFNDVECASNSYEIPGFKSAKECLLEGASRFSKEGFECGSNCKVESYGLMVCKEVCNKAGCGE